MSRIRKLIIVRGYGASVAAIHVEVKEISGTAQNKTGSKKTIGLSGLF